MPDHSFDIARIRSELLRARAPTDRARSGEDSPAKEFFGRLASHLWGQARHESEDKEEFFSLFRLLNGVPEALWHLAPSGIQGEDLGACYDGSMLHASDDDQARFLLSLKEAKRYEFIWPLSQGFWGERARVFPCELVSGDSGTKRNLRLRLETHPSLPFELQESGSGAPGGGQVFAMGSVEAPWLSPGVKSSICDHLEQLMGALVAMDLALVGPLRSEDLSGSHAAAWRGSDWVPAPFFAQPGRLRELTGRLTSVFIHPKTLDRWRGAAVDRPPGLFSRGVSPEALRSSFDWRWPEPARKERLAELQRRLGVIRRLMTADTEWAQASRHACCQLIRAYAAWSDGEKAAQICTCIEGLMLSDKEGSNTTARFVEAIAYRLGRPDSRSELRRFAEGLYDDRSRFMHSGTRSCTTDMSRSFGLAKSLIQKELLELPEAVPNKGTDLLPPEDHEPEFDLWPGVEYEI